MTETGNLLGTVYCLMGGLIVVLSVPLIRGWVRRNWIYGIRIPKAFKSEENWYAINRYGGYAMLVSGMLLALVGGGLLLWPPASARGILLSALAPIVIVLLPLVPIFRFANRLP